ncbi:MAG: PD-(D/E)XK nuclease family protein, partial [Litorimonas sp.]
VTPDQLLAQRVRARLARWNVDVSMSQGQPVEQTPVGVFLTALLDLARDPGGPVELSLVMGHDLAALGRAPGVLRDTWYARERKCRRGSQDNTQRELFARMDLVRELHAAAAPLLELAGNATPDAWASGLISAANAVAGTDETLGTFRLWSSDAGRQAANVLDGIATHGFALPATDAEGFSRLLSSMLQGAVVRPSRGMHPRLQILGPLEARLLDTDVIILGSLNEGTWPAGVDAGPFLSRGMREQMKLSLPERRYGLAAHDYAELAANRTVYLTRSQRDDSGPTVASRWVWRLKTLLAGAVGEEAAHQLLGTGQHYLDWARQMDRPSTHVAIERPNPKPPVEKRWARQGRRISITGVSRWIRDPYSLFGREVLRLSPLDPLDPDMDARQFGTAMHKAVEDYILEVKTPHEPAHRDRLAAQFAKALADHGFAPEEVFKERPRIEALTDHLMGWFAERHAAGYDVAGTEVEATFRIDDLDFTLHGVLDLVERSPTGYAFTDFKTGTPSSAATVGAGFDPQLPLAAWLAGQGALEALDKAGTDQMGYVRLKGSGDDFRHSHVASPGSSRAKSVDELTAEAIATLRALIAAYDRRETGYSSQPRVQYTHDYGDYDDLARRREWSDRMGGDE